MYKLAVENEKERRKFSASFKAKVAIEGVDMYKQIKEYVSFYNSERKHKSLGRITPDEKFYQEIKNVS